MTILQKIQNLTWWTLDIKVKDILTDLFGRITTLEESEGGGTQDLQSTTDAGEFTTNEFYHLLTSGDTSFKSGVIKPTGFPYNLNGALISNSEQEQSIGFVTSETGGFYSLYSGLVNKNLHFVFPDKPNPSYPVAEGYTIATLDDIQAPLPTYADNAAAIIGGLEADNWYKTATGELRVVV